MNFGKYKRLKPTAECLLKQFEDKYDLYQNYKINNESIEVLYKDFQDSPICGRVNWLLSQARHEDVVILMKHEYIDICGFLKNRDEIRNKIMSRDDINYNKNLWITAKGKQYVNMMNIKYQRRMNIIYPTVMAIISIVSVVTTLVTVIIKK